MKLNLFKFQRSFIFSTSLTLHIQKYSIGINTCLKIYLQFTQNIFTTTQ